MAGEVTFQMTEADMVAAGRDQLFGWLLTRKSLVRHLVMFGLLFAVGFAVPPACGCGGFDERLHGGLTLMGFLVAVMSALYIFSYLSLPRRTARLYRQQTSLHQPITLAWSDEALTARSRHGTLSYPWCDLASWSEVASAVAIKYGGYMYYLMPRRVLSDEMHTDLVATLEGSVLPRN